MFTDAMNNLFLGCAQWWRNESPGGSPAFRQQVVGTFSKRSARKDHSLRNRKFLRNKRYEHEIEGTSRHRSMCCIAQTPHSNRCNMRLTCSRN